MFTELALNATLSFPCLVNLFFFIVSVATSKIFVVLCESMPFVAKSDSKFTQDSTELTIDAPS